jgi:hypothetical protein
VRLARGRGWLAIGAAVGVLALSTAGVATGQPKPAPATSASPHGAGSSASPHGASPHDAAGATPHDPAGASPHDPAGASPHDPAGASPHDPAGASPHDAAGASPHDASPHGHMGGHGAMGGGRGLGFEPPADGAEADPSLAPGTLVVSVRNADDVPLADVDVALDVQHSSVARGDSFAHAQGRTDGSGNATFDGLQVGQGHSYRVSSSVGPGKFELEPFGMNDKSGMRAVLHLYEVTEDSKRVRVAMRSTISMSLKEDDIVVEQTYNIFNVSPAAWQADVEVTLPAGFKAFNTAEDQAGPLKVLPTERGAVLRGTVAPGQSDVAFRYHVPLEGKEAQDLEIALFPGTLQTQVAVEASKKMRLTAEGFPLAQFTHTQDGRSFLYTTRGLQQGPLEHFRTTIGGLPTRGIGGYLAVVLALVAVVAAVLYRAARHGRTDISDEKYADLAEARDTLLEEIAELERAHASGVVGPKTYGRARTLLTDALARIMLQLEQADRARSAAGGSPGDRSGPPRAKTRGVAAASA